jgi:hypothetical protein
MRRVNVKSVGKRRIHIVCAAHLCGNQNFADVADFARGFQPRTAGRLIIPNTTEAMDTGNLWGRQ